MMADPVESVISNDDLLTEILVRSPLLSLFLFKSVSKRWLYLIKQRAANLTLSRKPSDPPSGFLLEKHRGYDFIPLDNRIPNTNFTFGPEVLQHESDDVRILDSCNGLLLCRTTYSMKFYVCNPSITNMFKLLPEPDNNVTFNLDPLTGGLKLAFDPTKSSYYKVIYADIGKHATYAELVRLAALPDDAIDDWVQTHTFSSETGNWSLCGHHFPRRSFDMFGFLGVYWNDSIYWSYGVSIFKLDIMIEHPVLTALPTPLNLGNRHHSYHSFFVSRGRLLLVGYDFGGAQHTIFEKGNLHSEWSLKHIVDLNYIINPERFTIYDQLVCIVLGEREEDSFLVWRLGTKIVQHKIYPKRKYRIVSKTLSTISELGPNEKLLRYFQFIPSFANV